MRSKNYDNKPKLQTLISMVCAKMNEKTTLRSVLKGILSFNDLSAISKILQEISSRGGLEVEQWSDNRTLFFHPFLCYPQKPWLS